MLAAGRDSDGGVFAPASRGTRLMLAGAGIAMARRTKADADATRDNILNCAECLFVRQGVSRTTLQHIAAKAGVTRGAIYWRFEDKAALFNAMLQRVKMPLESAMQMLDLPDPSDPLGDLKEYAMRVFRLTEADQGARRVFEIAALKIEYVEEMTAVRERRAEVAARWMSSAEKRVWIAMATGQARADVQPFAVALGVWALMDGLLRAWIVAPNSFSLVDMGGAIVGRHLDSFRSPPS